MRSRYGRVFPVAVLVVAGCAAPLIVAEVPGGPEVPAFPRGDAGEDPDAFNEVSDPPSPDPEPEPIRDASSDVGDVLDAADGG